MSHTQPQHTNSQDQNWEQKVGPGARRVGSRIRTKSRTRIQDQFQVQNLKLVYTTAIVAVALALRELRGPTGTDVNLQNLLTTCHIDV